MLSRQRSATLAVFLGVFAMGAAPVFAQDRARQRPPTFSKEIVRIFQNRCQACHHQGMPFVPMSLVDYREVRPWAKSIKKKVFSREMPPWHADSSVREYANDISLPQEEIDLIVRWVDSGARAGDPADLPPAKTFEDGWKIGPPDLVLDMGLDFKVPAEGPLPYQYFRVETGLDEDQWVSAIEARPGNLDVVRQIVIYVQNPEDGAAIPDGGQLGNGRLGIFARGSTSTIFREGEGKLIKRGAKIVFQVHYTPNGNVATDRSSVGLRFHEAPARKHVITRGIAETRFEIPPHTPDFLIYATHIFARDVTLISMRPLMHYRGKEFKYLAHYPDGRNETLLHVNRYNYDWQVFYYAEEPIRLPAGTVLECIAIMDNSHDNFKNPEPHAVVSPGDQTYQEKMIGWIDYTID